MLVVLVVSGGVVVVIVGGVAAVMTVKLRKWFQRGECERSCCLFCTLTTSLTSPSPLHECPRRLPVHDLSPRLVNPVVASPVNPVNPVATRRTSPVAPTPVRD